jgi:two-component system C4-dicarboxylate transport response regulator DctD
MNEYLKSLQVIVIDDEAVVRQSMTQTLMLEGYVVNAFEEPQAAISLCNEDYPGVVICDVRMNIMSGLEVLRRIVALDSEIPVIMFSAHADIAIAVQAMHLGAYDFLEKTADPEQHINTVKRALKKRLLVLDNRQLRKNLQNLNGIDYRLIGQSTCMQRLREQVSQLAKMDIDLIINGLTGTGKEVVAQCLHDFSDRKEKPFVAINCGAIAESIIESELFGHEAGTFTGALKKRVGKIEFADGGTLFLDEIESMPASVQVRLLRVLQERKVQRLGSNIEVAIDIRVVAATKIDLLKLVNKGSFREDLYYRLNVANIELPNLAARKDDIPLLFNHFVKVASVNDGVEISTVPHELLSQLSEQVWPGNIRELRNTAQKWVLGLPLNLEAAIKENQTLSESEIVGGLNDSPSLGLDECVEKYEKHLISEMLSANQGHIEHTAKALGIPRKKLYLRMKKYGLSRSYYHD